MDIQIMKPNERNYTYTPNQTISEQAGLIGYLRADMDTNGSGFFPSWNDVCKFYKTQEFKEEFDNVINELRKNGNILSNRGALSKYCFSNMEASFGKDCFGCEREFGIRVNTDNYAYMMRLNPYKGEYNLYCYCYQKNMLDRQIQNSSNPIADYCKSVSNSEPDIDEQEK